MVNYNRWKVVGKQRTYRVKISCPVCFEEKTVITTQHPDTFDHGQYACPDCLPGVLEEAYVLAQRLERW